MVDPLLLSDFVIQTGAIVGTGSYTVSATVAYDLVNRKWRDVYPSGSTVIYGAKTTDQSLNLAKAELGIGVLTYGVPDTITRATILFSNSPVGDGTFNKINWVTGDDYLIYSAALPSILASLIVNNIGTSKPLWAGLGTAWLDASSIASLRLIDKLYHGGGFNAEKGRLHGQGTASGVYTPNMSRFVLETSTSGAVFDSSMVGKLIRLDVTAADRALALADGAAIATALGQSTFEFAFVGYGGAGHNVVVTPLTGQSINTSSPGVAANFAGGQRRVCEWDGTQYWIT